MRGPWSRWSRTTCGLLALAAGGLLSSVSDAEVVRLKNGNRLDGEVVSMTDAEIVIDIPGTGTLTFSRDEVASVEESGEKRYEYAEPDAPKAGASKKDRTDEAAFTRRAHAEDAENFFYKAAKWEPAPSSDESSDYAINALKRSRDLYERAMRAAQKALELDRFYEASQEEALAMKRLVQDARSRIAALSERLREAEQRAEANAKAKEEERRGFAIGELGDQGSPKPFQ